jgi:hypothetical protein
MLTAGEMITTTNPRLPVVHLPSLAQVHILPVASGIMVPSNVGETIPGPSRMNPLAHLPRLQQAPSSHVGYKLMDSLPVGETLKVVF